MDRTHDYYGYAPLVRPDRPVCLVGLPGAGSGNVARMVAMLSGLPFVWVDRGVEHRAGASVDAVVLTQGGQAARLAHERVLLPDALRQSQPHVVALSEVSLTDPGLRDLVRATATLVYLRRPQPSLVDAILDAQAKRAGAWARLGPATADIAATLARLEPPMRRTATHVVELGTHGVQASSRQVIETLGWSLPAVSAAPGD